MSKSRTGEQRRATVALLAAIPNLTPAELRICLMILEGKSMREAARDLGVSERTVGNQRYSIRRKMRISGNLKIALMKVRG